MTSPFHLHSGRVCCVKAVKERVKSTELEVNVKDVLIDRSVVLVT